MPDFLEYCNCIKDLWESRHLTNYGINYRELEKELVTFLNINNVIPVVNGTIALLVALDALDLPKGSEVITTPFSFVATASSIVWQNLKPVFVDIQPDTFNINPIKIKEKINFNTKAILTVHVFGNPCNLEVLQEIAEENNLKLLYDAAHCFGVNYNEKSILTYGDVSTLSFHATKVFHTIEGGAICTTNDALGQKLRKKVNFGQDKEGIIDEVGINGKINEFQAIMGLLNLKNINEYIRKRRVLYLQYLDGLKNLDVKFQVLNCSYDDYNFCYFPLLFKNQEIRDQVYKVLQYNDIMARQYFYPLINDMEAYRGYSDNNTPIAKNIAERILTLPLYPDLTIDDVDKITSIIRSII